MKKKYDAFISYSAEDKESFARPLAQKLMDYGLEIWFDDFCLNVGDSLLESIDFGLSRSKFGIVILSKSFLKKGWTKYELIGLLTREIGKKKVVLPIWKDITRDEIIKISPSLGDKYALNTTNLNIEQIAFSLIKVISPTIYNNFLRYLAWQQILADSQFVQTKLSNIIPSPIRHETLPKSQILRLKLVFEIFKDVLNISYSQFFSNFQRDLHPENEITVWERIAVAYLQLLEGKKYSTKEKKELLGILLNISMQPKESLIEMIKKGDKKNKEYLSAYLEAIQNEKI